MAIEYDATATRAEGDTGIPIAANTQQHITLDMRVAGILAGSINGTTITKTNDLPTTGNAGYHITMTALTAAVCILYWHHTMQSRQ